MSQEFVIRHQGSHSSAFIMLRLMAKTLDDRLYCDDADLAWTDKSKH